MVKWKRKPLFFSACINTKGLIFWLPLGHLYFVHECKLIPGLSTSSSSPACSPEGFSKNSFSSSLISTKSGLLHPTQSFLSSNFHIPMIHPKLEWGYLKPFVFLAKAFVFLAKGRGTDLAYLKSVTDHGHHWMGRFVA